MSITHIPKNVLWIIFSYLDKSHLFKVCPKVCVYFNLQITSFPFISYLMNIEKNKHDVDIYPISGNSTSQVNLDMLFSGPEVIDRVEENKKRLCYMMNLNEPIIGCGHCNINCLQYGNTCWRIQQNLLANNRQEYRSQNWHELQNLPRFDSPIERSLIKNSCVSFQNAFNDKDDNLNDFFQPLVD